VRRLLKAMCVVIGGAALVAVTAIGHLILAAMSI
jgi:hypothetical protein